MKQDRSGASIASSLETMSRKNSWDSCSSVDDGCLVYRKDTYRDALGAQYAKQLESFFPGVLAEEDFIEQASKLLQQLNFTPENALNMVSNNRDETSKTFVKALEKEWGMSFNISSLAGMVFSAKTRFKAVDGKQRYVIWVAPHVALPLNGDEEKVFRHGRENASPACGTVLGLVAEIEGGRINGEVRSNNSCPTEASVVKSYAAHKAILDEAIKTAGLAVDLNKSEFIIISGIRVHGPNGQNYFWPGTFTHHTKEAALDMHDAFHQQICEWRLAGTSPASHRQEDGVTGYNTNTKNQMPRMKTVRGREIDSSTKFAYCENEGADVSTFAPAPEPNKSKQAESQFTLSKSELIEILKASNSIKDSMEHQSEPRYHSSVCRSTGAPDINLARENFKRWNDALQTKNPKMVADLYIDGELSFLPTVSPEHVRTTSKTEDYFLAFVQKNPFGIITDDSIQAYGNDAYLHSGMYTFELGTGSKRAPVEARFSYVWKKDGDSWKISHHHSSVRPEAPKATQMSKTTVWSTVVLLLFGSLLAYSAFATFGPAALGLPTANVGFGAWEPYTHPSSRASTGLTPDINLARENFKRWNDALQTKNPKMVADLYTNGELSFLPTVSPEHVRNTSKTEDYFIAFVQKNPFGFVTDDSIQAYGDDAYLHSGLYTFDLDVGGKRAPVEARFSYVWKKDGGSWKISHHHSSVRPPTGPAPDINLARANFKRWNDALQTKNPKMVADLYTNGELSFLPTVSPEHVKDLAGTEDYFLAFVQKNPFGIVTDDSIQAYGHDAYLHSGMYTFDLDVGGKRAPVEARFSYVWKRDGGSWKISHHHSSVRPPTGPAPDINLARENFKRWNDALQTKNPKMVADLYTEGALSFLPTVSPEHVKDLSGTEDYFIAFVQKNPFGVITDDSIQAYGNDAYLHSGMYTFDLDVGGKRAPVEARFSYVWKKDGNSWKISHHHSSVRPEAPKAAQGSQTNSSKMPQAESDATAAPVEENKGAVPSSERPSALPVDSQECQCPVVPLNATLQIAELRSIIRDYQEQAEVVSKTRTVLKQQLKTALAQIDTESGIMMKLSPNMRANLALRHFTGKQEA